MSEQNGADHMGPWGPEPHTPITSSTCLLFASFIPSLLQVTRLAQELVIEACEHISTTIKRAVSLGELKVMI